MRYFLFAIMLISNFCWGQDFKFDTKYYEAVDRWVVFDKKEADSTYLLGFIYIDDVAGFTFRYTTRIKNTDSGLEKLPEDPNGMTIARLEQNTAKTHVLTEEERQQLDLPTEPDWLEIYKSGEDSASYLKSIGYHYNHVGASKNALKPLLKAYDIDPHYDGLEFELAFAYNATEKYDKAIEVLEKALKNDPDNFWFYRELGYTFIKQGKTDKAEDIYKQGITLSNNKNQKAEMAYNMVYSYFEAKDKTKFDEWVKIIQEYMPKGSQFERGVIYFTENWDN